MGPGLRRGRGQGRGSVTAEAGRPEGPQTMLIPPRLAWVEKLQGQWGRLPHPPTPLSSRPSVPKFRLLASVSLAPVARLWCSPGQVQPCETAHGPGSGTCPAQGGPGNPSYRLVTSAARPSDWLHQPAPGLPALPDPPTPPPSCPSFL